MNEQFSLSEQDYLILEEQISEIVNDNSLSESDLYSIIGQNIVKKEKSPTRTIPFQTLKGLEKYGLRAGSQKSFGLLSEKYHLNRLSDLDFDYSEMPILPDEPIISEAKAAAGGKKFWEKLMENLKKEICSNESIRKYFSGGSQLNDALRVIIPIVVVALGITIINPLVLAAIAAIVALIIKVGYKTYCEI